MLEEWKTLSRKVLLDRAPWLVVEEHEVELPDGRVIPDWTWVIVPDFANVVAITPEGRFVCFRQPKYAVEGVSLAPPAGIIEPGETPLAAAKRELLEEAGYEADEWISLGAYPEDSNRGVAMGHFFLAKGARPVAQPNADDLEDQELVMLSRDEVVEALCSGGFKVMSWAAIFSMTLVWLDLR